ncbi:Leucine-rich repeat-containing protein 4C [Amphibalanus amphitrite]|uniref:Leucine-rich repeat-containing protein 4C n=1 Tax=Amphibalanus amphitrite TaxID=1232801 RepID=A0A6A4WYN3_AMPAM|nr:leucine-rich repeat-containing protein 24-like [Amphibalanus amphitrite]KAF0310419.1 Leucine-rich repeat-containing protein 4C [Amphibalanus amphitrite]
MAGRPPPSAPLALLLLSVLLSSSVGGGTCPPVVCMCSWTEGRGSAVCVNGSLTEVPPGLSTGTTALQLDGNPLQVLTAGSFLGNGLAGLQRLQLARCQLGHIDRRAFSGLASLETLDLSHNVLLLVPADALSLLPGLRRLLLDRNPIRRISDGTFEELTQLEELSLSNCGLEELHVGAFRGLARLRELKLDGNRLTTLSAGTLEPLAAVRQVLLNDNPWSCDCRVRPLKQWLDRLRPSQPREARCDEPLRLRNSTFSVIRLGQFSCPPVMRQGTRRLTAWAGDNVTLSCSVTASPEAVVVWLWRGKLVTNGTGLLHGNTRFHVYEHGHEEKTSMLTIEDAQSAAAGQYTCEARNSAGRVSRLVSVGVAERDSAPHLTLRLDHGVLAGVLAAGLLLAVAGCLCLCLVCARARRAPASAPTTAQPAPEANHKNGASVANGRPAGAGAAQMTPAPVQTVVHARQTSPTATRTETVLQPPAPAAPAPAPAPAAGPPVATIPPEPAGWAPDVRAVQAASGGRGEPWPVELVYAPGSGSAVPLVHTCGKRGGSLRSSRRAAAGGHWRAGSDSGVLPGGERDVRFNSLPRCGTSRMVSRTPANLSPFSDLTESSNSPAPSPEPVPCEPESGRRSAASRSRRRRHQRPSLPSSPVLSGGELDVPDGGSQLDPYSYHAVQLDRYLQEYRSLQDQLTAMQQSCHSLQQRPAGRQRRSLPSVRPDADEPEPPPPPSPTVRQLKPILKSHDHVPSAADPLAPRRAPHFAPTNTYFSYSES